MTTMQQKRKDAILALIYQSGFAEVTRLSADLDVSEATVRRDLKLLAREGLLELTHGGASVARGRDRTFLARSVRQVEAKRAIGRLAASLVEDGDQVFLDSGTTCFQMSCFLRGKRGVSVILNSIRTAQELYAPGMNVLLIGGQYRVDRSDTVGPLAAASLGQLRGYVTFIGCDGLAMDIGPCAVDIESASLFGQAASNGKKTVVVADRTKFESAALYRVVGWDAVSAVVTDERPGDAWMDFFAGRKIDVLYPQATA